MGKRYTEQGASVETRKRQRDTGRPRPRHCWLGVDLGHGGTSRLRGSIKTTTIDSHITERFPSENHREVNTPSRDSQKQEPHIADELVPYHFCHGPLCMYLSSLCIYLGVQPGPSPNLTSIQYLPKYLESCQPHKALTSHCSLLQRGEIEIAITSHLPSISSENTVMDVDFSRKASQPASHTHTHTHTHTHSDGTRSNTSKWLN
jgi:hypothetical protein